MHFINRILFCLLCLPIVAHSQVVNEKQVQPHFKYCFTQGLIISDNIVWESCGGYGQSQLIQWKLDTQEILQKTKIEDKYFAEGLTELNGHLFMLTWKSGIAFEIDPKTLKTIKQHKYQGQGWGLTSDGKQLIMSNGSDIVQFIDPVTFKVERTTRVRMVDASIYGLNELEYIDGKIWANVFQTDYIVVIDPKNGLVTDRKYFPNLLRDGRKKPGVLNGIAYDKIQKKTWLTGKNWPLLFEL